MPIIHIRLKSAFLRTTKSTLLFHNALYNTAQNFFPVSNHGGSKEATRGCGTVWPVFFFSGLINMFVFDILRIPSDCE
jgi:hypothetical protein